MRTRNFLSQLDHGRIVQSIRTAEGKSSGQIRVYVQRGKFTGDPLVAARENFQKLEMQSTRERNAILIFVVPRARKFAVIGDEGIHQKCEPSFWEKLIERMQLHFQNKDFTQALVGAIEESGNLLAHHFPKPPVPRNELPDEVIEG